MVVIGLSLVLLLAGLLFAFSQLDIEAYPDPVQPMVEVLTLPNGLSAEEVERLVTVPLEFGLSGMRDLESMRSISLFGLSDIRCYFSWDSDYYWDRIGDHQPARLRHAAAGIRAGISPENPIGEIYRYTVESPDHDLIKEKEIEDWVLEKQLKTVPGVIDVSGFGGLTKEYHVDVDPQRLAYYHIPLSTLISSIGNSNINAGGNYLTSASRPSTFAASASSNRSTTFATSSWRSTSRLPITVGNVAERRGRLRAAPRHRRDEQPQRGRRTASC